MSESLNQWVIYDHPRDDPDHYVVRRWEIMAQPGNAEMLPRESTAVQTLEEARQVIQDQAPGSVCLTRAEQDDPTIVEVWL